MSAAAHRHERHMVARADQPLIAVPIERNGKEHIHYFVDDSEADAALAEAGTRRPIKLAGIWSDLDEEEVLARLDLVRRQSTPTPPLADV